MCVVQRIIECANETVSEHNTNPTNPRKHNSLRNVAMATCPAEVAKSRGVYPIACPCREGPTYTKIAPRPGPTLILVPPALLTNWKQEYDNLINDHSNIVGRQAYSMRLVLLHGSNPSRTQITAEDLHQAITDSEEGGKNTSSLIILTSAKSYDTQVRKFLDKAGQRISRKIKVRNKESYAS